MKIVHKAILDKSTKTAFKYKNRRILVFFDKDLEAWRAICLDGYILERGFSKSQAIYSLLEKIELDIDTEGSVRLPAPPPPIFYSMYFWAKVKNFLHRIL